MLHAKFRGNRPAGSGEDFEGFLAYMSVAAIFSGHVTQMPRTNFCSPYTRRLHIKFAFDRPSDFREEDV